MFCYLNLYPQLTNFVSVPIFSSSTWKWGTLAAFKYKAVPFSECVHLTPVLYYVTPILLLESLTSLCSALLPEGVLPFADKNAYKLPGLQPHQVQMLSLDFIPKKKKK